MTLAEAAKAGHERVIKPVWALPEDYLRLRIYDGRLAPLSELYSPMQLDMPELGRPQKVLLVGDWTQDDDWEPYTGSPAADER